VREVGWRLFIGGARARRRTAAQRSWYGAQGKDTAGTGGPSGARPVRVTRRMVRRATRGGGLRGSLGTRMPWEGAVPRSTRGPDGEAGRCARQRVTSRRGAARRRRPDSKKLNRSAQSSE
jgi:hypothetical protein